MIVKKAGWYKQVFDYYSNGCDTKEYKRYALY